MAAQGGAARGRAEGAPRRGGHFVAETRRRRGGRRGPPAGIDGYSFAIAFKGVLLEGLEVAFIVLTFGANQHNVGLAAAAAGVAIAVVVLAGVAVKAPLARVPENTMKFGVGVMLTSFGMFWGAEGAGAHWPGGDAALLVIIPVTLAFARRSSTWLARSAPRAARRGARREPDQSARAARRSGSSSSATTG